MIRYILFMVFLL